MKAFFSIALLLIPLSSLPSQAQELRLPNLDTTHEVTLPSLTKQATLVVEGRVVSFRSFWDKQHSTIYTASTIEVYKVFKGEVNPPVVELITYGGFVGDAGMSSTENVQLDDHTVGIFFLRPSLQPSEGSNLPASQVAELVSGRQGFVRYSGDRAENYAATSRFRTYPQIETSLYPKIQELAGRPFVVKKQFDIKRYDRVQERLTGVDAATTPDQTSPTEVKKKASPNADGVNARTQATAIYAFSEPGTSAGTFRPFIIYGEGFQNPTNPMQKPIVQFRNAEDFSSVPSYMDCPELNIKSFTDTEIVLFGVPSNDGGPSTNDPNGKGAGTGYVRVTSTNGFAQSPDQLVIYRSEATVNFASIPARYAAFRQTRLVNQNQQGGYTLKYEPTLYNNPTAVRAVQRSLEQWRCATTVNFGDDISQAVPFNTTDAICNIGFVAQADQSTAMQTKIRYALCSPAPGEYYVFTDVFDIEINPSYQWDYEQAAPGFGQTDFRTDMLHEIGHAVGLRHVLDQSKIMYFYTGAGTYRQTLSAEPELNGAASALNRSQTMRACNSGSNFLPHTPLTATNCEGGRPSTDITQVFVDRCTLSPATITITASGGTTYKWAGKDHFNNTNPTTRSVTASTAPYTPIGVYSSKNGLGGTALINIGFIESFQPCGGGAAESRTTAYPNPSTGDMTIDYTVASDARQDVEFVLHNSQGTIIKTFRYPGNSQRRSFPIRGLNRGLYYLRTMENGRALGTLMLQVEK